MSAWKNKHVIIATLMAPVLALIAYFGVNAMVGETPKLLKPEKVTSWLKNPTAVTAVVFAV